MAKTVTTKEVKKELQLSNTKISWFSRFVFFLFTLLFIGVYNADEFHFMSINSHLIFNNETLTFILNRTGGLLVLLGRIFNQSFFVPLLSKYFF